jgi:hypothetical protein
MFYFISCFHTQGHHSIDLSQHPPQDYRVRASGFSDFTTQEKKEENISGGKKIISSLARRFHTRASRDAPWHEVNILSAEDSSRFFPCCSAFVCGKR